MVSALKGILRFLVYKAVSLSFCLAGDVDNEAFILRSVFSHSE